MTSRQEQEAQLAQALKDDTNRKILYSYLFELRKKYNHNGEATNHTSRIEMYLTCIPFDMDQLINFVVEEWMEAAIAKQSTDHSYITWQYTIHNDFRDKLIELGCIK